MSLIDIKKIRSDASAEVAKEKADKAKLALIKKLRELETAKEVVRNIERSISDLEQSIADGSFTG